MTKREYYEVGVRLIGILILVQGIVALCTQIIGFFVQGMLADSALENHIAVAFESPITFFSLLQTAAILIPGYLLVWKTETCLRLFGLTEAVATE